MTDIVKPPLDAYGRPREVREGCTHQLGCRCDPSYWLRASSPVEVEREEFMRRRFKVP